MKLVVNICSEADLLLSVNGELRRCKEDGKYIFTDLPNSVNVKIKQIEAEFKWYLFPIYMLLGFITLLLNSFSEYSSTTYLCPYIQECTFDLKSSIDSYIDIKFTTSSVGDNGICEQGHITVEGKNVFNIVHRSSINENSFQTAYAQTCFACISGPIVFSTVMGFFIWSTSFASILGIVICILISIFLFFIATMKIIKEKRFLNKLRSKVIENCIDNGIEQ